eukprot:TRINITY_DN2224_c0_g1_i1.p1 TRINITY_DN2224_c0_g1~~TRINITY_DN2224_c0_g1_i1.p1  ORF type:complete len:1351 (-),score=128.95 TRINITY_DN2224_c0_g1_i1:1423-5475(-)
MATESDFRLKLSLSAAATPSISVRVAPFSTSTNNTPILLLPANKKPAVAYLVVSATAFVPTSYSWSWVANSLNSYAVAPTTTSPFGKPAAVTKLTLSQPGIYRFMVVAKSGSTSVTKNVWVNLWSNRPALNTDGSVGTYPGLTPPKSVRTLYPDPGPFNHPRLLFTALDWPELTAKVKTSSDVSTALSFMETYLLQGLDASGTAMNALALGFYEYHSSRYNAAYYATLVNIYKANSAVTGETLLGKSPLNSIYDALACACYVAWLKYDPTRGPGTAPVALRQRFIYLANIVAAAAKFELAYNGALGGLSNGHQKYSLAFCYDIAYYWMSTAQKLDTRSYLYSIGYGIYNNAKGGLTYTTPYVPSGSMQDGGDFPNLADGCILAALVIEGEESTVPPAVRARFGPYVPAVTGAWAGAGDASVSNLHRQIRHNSEWNLTHWGFRLNMVDYYELGQNVAMYGSLAFARRWENQFVTTHIYQSCLAVLYNLCRRESDGKLVMFDHHDGYGILPGNKAVGAVYISKYMFPNDAAIDFYYKALQNETQPYNYPLGQAIFATDIFTTSLYSVAAAKKMGNLKFDPHRTACIARNGWLDTDLMLQFENRWDNDGHMHAEKNNFSLYALGRAWSNPTGYHITISDMQASILVQIPSLIGDRPTNGYVGQSPSSATQTLTNNNFPPIRGKLMQVFEDPAETWTIFSGDAATAYNFASSQTGLTPINSKVPLQSLPYPGLRGVLVDEDLAAYTEGNLMVGLTYNPVLNAKRTVFTVRDSAKVHPYVLVMDDFAKDGTARNYRWTMANCISNGNSAGRFVEYRGYSVYSSLAILGTSTSTEAVVFHDPIDQATVSGQAGLPRLLVRDVANVSNASQPPIFIDDRPLDYAGGNLTYGFDNNSGSTALTRLVSRRLMIQRNAVVTPGYKVLLYPFLSSAKNTLPTTKWLSDTQLEIAHPNGVTDTITFSAQAPVPASGKAQLDALRSQLTNIIGFTRARGSSQALPTITIPSGIPRVTCSYHNSQGFPTHRCNFAITAKDANGKALAYSSNGAKGSFIAVGYPRVWVSAIDSKGQQVSVSFQTAVLPSAPAPTLTRVINLAKPYSAELKWSFWPGVTGYRVKRSTKSGGPYKTIASLNQYTTTFVDTKMPHPTTFYVVTALMKSYGLNIKYESSHSTELSTAPASIGTLVGNGIGGALLQTSASGAKSFLLSAVQGQFNANSEQGLFLSASVSGNGTYIARCKSFAVPHPYGGFGIDYRADLTQSSVSAFISYDPKQQIHFSTRPVANAPATISNYVNAGLFFPLWFKLVRTGIFFFGYWSEDGVAWHLTGTVRISNMPKKGLVCLALTSPYPMNAEFDNVSFL